MLLRELYEAERKTAVLAFGRLNPPTIGHGKLVDTVKSVDGDHYLFLSQSQKPKTDPLDFATKLKFAKQFFPDVNVGHQAVRTPVQALEMLQSLGYTDVVFIAGSDRVDGFQKLFDTYNGQPDKSGKVPFKFNSIKVVSAGERDPDADDVSGMSASKMRVAAAAGDLEAFAKGVPNPKLAKTMFDAVRKGMGITEPVEEILGFATKRPKTTTIKKKRPPEEDSVQDKIKKRRAMAAKDDPNAFKTGAVKEQNLDEIAPAIGAAVMWILRWIAVRGAWPVLKWLLKKLAKYIIGGSAAAIAISEGWEWVTDKIGEEATQMLIDNKFTIAMAVTLILGAVVLKKWIEKHGEKFAAKYAESLEQGDLSWMN